MMSRSKLSKKVGFCALFGVMVLLPLGCAGEVEDEAPRTVRKVVDPGPPPPPPVTAIDDLMEQMGIDERVVMPEESAPNTDEARRTVLSFFDAFARGDARTAGEMMEEQDKAQLDMMVEEGVWEEVTGDSILEIQIMTGRSPDGEYCALALFETEQSLSLEPQLWQFDPRDVEPVFSAVPSPPGMIDRLSGDDWITGWFEILDEEVELALKPDEDLEVPQVDLDQAPASSGARTSGGSSPTPPGGRPGMP